MSHSTKITLKTLENAIKFLLFFTFLQQKYLPHNFVTTLSNGKITWIRLLASINAIVHYGIILFNWFVDCVLKIVPIQFFHTINSKKHKNC